MTGVKKEEQSPRIGTFEFALAEAKRRAWAANPSRKLPLEKKDQASTPVIAEQVKVTRGEEPADKPPHANKYGGLTAAKKRKREVTATTNAPSPAPRSEDSSSVSSPLPTPTEEGSNRPFAPPKKAKRAPTKYDDM